MVCTMKWIVTFLSDFCCMAAACTRPEQFQDMGPSRKQSVLYQTFDQLRQQPLLTALVASDTAVAELSALKQINVDMTLLLGALLRF